MVTSDSAWEYNCIAHAADENMVPWWPMEEETEGVYWPPGVPREETLDAFIAAYKTKDYAPLDEIDLTLQQGMEKIAIFADSDGTPTHAARQLPSGEWTSKLGYWEDIRHESPSCLESGDYGRVAKVLQREFPHGGHQ